MDIKKKIKIIEEISIITNKLNELEKILLNEDETEKVIMITERAGKPSYEYRPSTSNLRWIKSLRSPFN